MENAFLLCIAIGNVVAKAGLYSCFFLYVTLLPAQPSIQWQKALGGTQAEEAESIQQTSDGGYIVVGYSASNNGNVLGWHGNIDFWVVKLSSTGDVQWQKMLGGAQAESAYSVQQTSDGGYIVAGYTNSNNGDVSGLHGESDFWVVKLSAIGSLEWQKTLGGSNEDVARSIRQTSDGGYIISGWTFSTDGDVTFNHGYSDVWVVKLNEFGDIQWQKSYGGGTGNDQSRCIRQTSDGGYILTGETDSSDGDISGYHGGNDIWVLKLNNSGIIEWQKALGGSGIEASYSIQQTTDGGFIVGGLMSSNDGDITMHQGLFDFWIVKLTVTGEIQWQKSLGGSDSDWGRSVWQTTDGGYVVAGETSSTDGDVTLNDGGTDCWIVRLNDSGEIQWQKTFGGTKIETCRTVNQTSDGGFVVAGYTQSNDGDVSGFHGGLLDFWIVKLSPTSTPTAAPSSLPLEIFPNPAYQSISLNKPTLDAESTEVAEELTVRITDLLGRNLSRQTIPANAQIDISALPNGMYILSATTPSGKVFSGKFRKQE